MPFRHKILATKGTMFAAGSAPGLALAASGPVVNDRKVNRAVTSAANPLYGITAWGATASATAPTCNANPSYAGVVGFDPIQR